MLAGAGTVVAAQEAEVACEIAAEVADRDPKGLNVRAGPGAKHAVIANLPTTHGVVVEVRGASGPWLRIVSAADGRSETDYGKRAAWVYGPLLSFDAWSRGKVRAVPMRSEAEAGAKVVAEVPVGRPVALTGCRGRWAKGRYEGREGWIAPEHRCANPFTECQ
jgi:SH3-like domain-containing protein